MSATKLTIYHLNTYQQGGSFEYANLLSQGMESLGHDSQLVTRRAEERPLIDRVANKASLSFARGPWHGHLRFLPPPVVTPKNTTIVHLHTVGDWFNVLNWVRTLPPEIRIFAGLHDLWHISGGCFIYESCKKFESNCRPCPLLRFPANQILSSWSLRAKLKAYKARRVNFIFNSQWLHDLTCASPIAGGTSSVVIPPPIDPTVFFPHSRRECRNQFGVTQEDRVIVAGCASLTDKNKNITGLLSILENIDVPNLKIILFGEGKLDHPPSLSVSFTGKLESRQQLARLYSAADLFVSTSKMETFGLTLLEALACGTPVVAYRVGGIPEALAIAPKAAQLVTPFNEIEFRMAVLSAFNRQPLDQAERIELSRAILRKHSPENAARQSLHFYEEAR